MPYPKVNWQNGEVGGTPLNAENLNIMDNAIKANENAIVQNTADIEELKNKPTTALILASASPLPNTTASNILGIDVSGKSEQITVIDTVSGKLVDGSVGKAINQSVSADGTRCISNVLELKSGATITVNSGYDIYVFYAASASGNIITVNGWNSGSYITTADGFYRFLVRKSDNSAITPSSFVLSDVPTPTNPIPIVDASTEIVAKTKNLFSTSHTSQTVSGITATKNADGSIALSGTATANTTLFVTTMDMKKGTYTFSGADDGSTSTYYIQIADNPITKELIAVTTAKQYTFTDDTSITFRIRVLSGKTVNTIIYPQIEEGTTATDYVPFESNSITLPYTLRSVGTVADTLVINSDGSGKLTQNVKNITLDGGWSMASTTSIFYIDHNAKDGKVGNVMSNYGLFGATIGSAGEAGRYPNMICIQSLDGLRFAIYAPDFTTADDFNARLAQNPITIYYPLATPIVTDLTAEQVSSVLALKTYNGTTIIDSELDVNSVSYSADVKGYVEEASASMALNSMKVTRNIPSMEEGEITYTIQTPTGFPYLEKFKYKAYIVQAGAFVPFRLDSVTCTSTYISVSVTFPDGVSGAGTLELLLYWDEYKPIDVAPIAMVMSVDEGGIAE